MTFNVGQIYPSAIKGLMFRVKARHLVQDTIVCLVYRESPTALFGRTNGYYLAIEEEDGKTAVVLLDDGFTTIYDEGKRID